MTDYTINKSCASIIALAVFLPISSHFSSANENYGSYNDDPKILFDASELFHETMKIKWIRVNKDEVLKECNTKREQYNLDKTKNPLNGCTIWDKEFCIVITEKATSMHTLGHEIRHCYQHSWH
jgi:hypothetical protein